MKPVCFVTMSHNTITVSDFIKYCHAEALSEGLNFYMARQIQPNAVNIVLDGLKDSDHEQFVENKRAYKQNGVSILYLQTEVVRNNTLNSGLFKMVDHQVASHGYEAADYWGERFRNFNLALKVADHVACMHYLTRDHLLSKGYHNTSLVLMRYHNSFCFFCNSTLNSV